MLAFILWNEAADLWNEHWPDAGQQYGEGAKDIALTMFVPTLLMIAARLRPDLFRAPHGARGPIAGVRLVSPAGFEPATY